MASQLISMRYPAGLTEYQLSEKKPDVGDVLKRNGDNWVVVAVEESADGACVATLRSGVKPVKPA